MNIILETLNSTKIGESVIFQNMEMAPLLSKCEASFDYKTLDEALNTNTARIKETSESGTVPELTFFNEGETPVFLMDGEELVGAKQNRVLNLSIMAPVGKSITIPVSCVEAGRWSYSSNEFRSGPRAQYATARASKSKSVSQNMRMSQSYRSDQQEVWSDISAKSARMEAHSPTAAMSEMYEKRTMDLEKFVERFKAVDGQLGFVFLIDKAVAGLDLFDKPETLLKLMPKLVRSYALDALDTRSRRPAPSDQEKSDLASNFLDSVKNAPMDTFPSIGIGQDLRPSTGSISGGALVVDGTLIHLGVFPGEEEVDGSSPGRNAALVRASRRRRAH